MNILLTGANGFVGKNLSVHLETLGYDSIDTFTKDNDYQDLDDMCARADFVFHLAGVNRPKDNSEFQKGNIDLTQTLLEYLKKHKNHAPVLLASSIQAENDNEYGRTKQAAETLVLEHAEALGIKSFVYRLPNVFGKWSKPNYNSVVSTFCHNIANSEPIKINDASVELTLVHIDDVLDEFIRALNNNENRDDQYCRVPIVHTITLGQLAETIQSFKQSRDTKFIPDMGDALTKKLYATYLTYLPTNDFSYPLKMNVDQRGSFTEVLKTIDRGQVSVNVSKPGITKGNHWHHSKNEKFLVVSGRGVIRFRHIHDDNVIEYYVDESSMEVVDIPPGYTHNIENLGDKDMVTLMWANEPFDPENPDTYYEEV